MSNDNESGGMLHRCATCKHWRRYTSELDVKYNGKHAGTCNSESFVEGTGAPRANGLLYWDYEGHSAGFSTGENFGCVHWSEA